MHSRGQIVEEHTSKLTQRGRALGSFQVGRRKRKSQRYKSTMSEETMSEVELDMCEPEVVLYNRALQGGAVAVICVASAIGSITPIILSKLKILNQDSFAFLLLRSFGVGLIVSTAIVHMFLPAHEIFIDEDECGGVPMGWRVCRNWAGIFMIIGAFFVQFVQTMVLDHFAVQGAHVEICTDDSDSHNAKDLTSSLVHVQGEGEEPHGMLAVPSGNTLPFLQGTQVLPGV